MAETPVTKTAPVTKTTPVLEKTPSEMSEKFGGILNTLSSFRQQITMLQNQVRGLEKIVNKTMRQMTREAKKNKNKGTENLRVLQSQQIFQKIYVILWENPRDHRLRERKLRNISSNILHRRICSGLRIEKLLNLTHHSKSF